MNKVIETLAKEIARLEEELRVHKEAMKLLKGHFEPKKDEPDELDMRYWISMKAVRALIAAGINNLTELEEFVINGGQLLSLERIGRKSMGDIAVYLKECSKRQAELQPFFSEYCQIIENSEFSYFKK